MQTESSSAPTSNRITVREQLDSMGPRPPPPAPHPDAERYAMQPIVINTNNLPPATQVQEPPKRKEKKPRTPAQELQLQKAREKRALKYVEKYHQDVLAKRTSSVAASAAPVQVTRVKTVPPVRAPPPPAVEQDSDSDDEGGEEEKEDSTGGMAEMLSRVGQGGLQVSEYSRYFFLLMLGGVALYGMVKQNQKNGTKKILPGSAQNATGGAHPSPRVTPQQQHKAAPHAPETVAPPTTLLGRSGF